MKQAYTTTLALLFTLIAQFTIAQTVTLNWGTSIQGNWRDGNTSGTANSIGGSSINATINIANSQSSPNPYSGFTLFTSPTATNTYVSALNSTAKSLGIGVNWDSKSRYADITIKFSGPVTNVKFNVADIDKLSASSTNYIDQVTITGTKSNIAVNNPTLSKLVTNSQIFSISGNTATANTTNGGGGNAGSTSTDQSGTVVVDFGATQLDQIMIHYQNNAAADNDPGQQFILVGGIAFQPVSTLPLTLASFNGLFKNNAVQLSWVTTQEENVDKFIVEKSGNATDWQSIASVKATGNSPLTNTYGYTDAAAGEVNYYRLKMVDIDGKYTYSQTIQIRSGVQESAGIKIYPNPVTTATTLNITTPNKLNVHIRLFNQFGMQLQNMTRMLIAGTNNIPVTGISNLPIGNYIVTVEDETGKKIGTSQFLKK